MGFEQKVHQLLLESEKLFPIDFGEHTKSDEGSALVIVKNTNSKHFTMALFPWEKMPAEITCNFQSQELKVDNIKTLNQGVDELLKRVLVENERFVMRDGKKYELVLVEESEDKKDSSTECICDHCDEAVSSDNYCFRGSNCLDCCDCDICDDEEEEDDAEH